MRPLLPSLALGIPTDPTNLFEASLNEEIHNNERLFQTVLRGYNV